LADELALEHSHLTALGALGATCFAHPEDLIDRGLKLLVTQLEVDRAMVASVTSRGLETLWCSEPRDLAPAGPDPNLGFCPHVLAEPAGPLVIPDAGGDPRWAEHPGRAQGVRAYLGAPLRHSAKAVGVLSVQCGTARAWGPPEVALVSAVAALFGKAMEVEILKVRLRQAQEALDLSTAVLEDSAMEAPGTGLPSRAYLELWCRSHLALARRRGEPIALATWAQPPEPGRKKLLERLCGELRGVDLLVDLGRDRFLLVLPRTQRPGAETALERVRGIVGRRPMGATLWNPLLNPDRDAPSLQPAIRRAQDAASGTLEPGGEGADDGNVAWSILEPSREAFLDGASQW
jgi:GGDEF domain-containing protein